LKKNIPPLDEWHTRWYLDHPDQFDISKLEANQMIVGNGQVLAKIPDLDGRIRIERDEEKGDIAVRLVIRCTRDEHTGEVLKEETVRLGYDMGGEFQGMMVISDHYYDYFDTFGNMLQSLELEEEGSPESKASGGDEAAAKISWPTLEDLIKLQGEVPEFDWISFDPRKMTTNEVRNGPAVLARIPKIEGMITRHKKKTVNGVQRYIDLVLDRHYDKEKKQSRNTRVVIGTDISHIYPDMMLTGKRYHEFFDTAGNLLPQYLPDKLKEEKQKKTQKEKNMAEENKTEMHPEEKITETEENKENMAPTSFSSTAHSENVNNSAIVSAPEAHTPESEEERQRKQQKHTKDRLNMLRNMLYGYKDVIDEQAKRRPYYPVTGYMVRKINDLLVVLRTLFAPFEGSEFLGFAEEPDPKDPSKGTTFADMAILLTSYDILFSAYISGRLWPK